MNHYRHDQLAVRSGGCGCSSNWRSPDQPVGYNMPMPAQPMSYNMPKPTQSAGYNMPMPTQSAGYNMPMPTQSAGYNMPMPTQSAGYNMPMPANQPSYNMPMPSNMMSMQSKSDENLTPYNEVLRLLEEAVNGETADKIFYQQLIALAPTKADKEIISGIRDDELSHFALFRQIYHELTGKQISPAPETTPEKQQLSYLAGLRKALFGEIEAVKKYRKIRAGLNSKRHRDILFNIITDELTHQSKYNYLIATNLRT